MIPRRSIWYAILLHHNQFVKILFAPDLPTMRIELSGWFFDYLSHRQVPVLPLPPMDDWHRSIEKDLYYEIAFPSPQWRVIVQSDMV